MNFSFKSVKGEIVLPIAVLCLLAMIVLPLPPILLDVFFTMNIIVSLIILAKTINVDRPLGFTTFPAIILIATIMRLAMNVASTRVILLEGHNGAGAAGSVIESFGDFVIGGQYAVGLIVFLILVVINFIVITKGTGRISEVSARFKLDSLPGKQMAIDADVNSGVIDNEQAKQRREELQLESDFHGSMDGASKFVKGDAIAGIIILLINIVGGLILGVSAHDLSFGDAAETYILLTIGDGIVAQIPGLILSVATGVIITRAGKNQSLGEQVRGEFLNNGKNFYFAGVILFILGCIPGMPNVAFLFFAACIASCGYFIDLHNKKLLVSATEVVVEEVQSNTAEVTWDDIEHVKPLEIHVGFGLIDWIQKEESDMLNMLKGLRRKLSKELGFLISPISLKDDMSLSGPEYAVILNGEKVSSFELVTNKLLAIGEKTKKLRGVPVIEPVFGLEARWISPEEKGMVESMGASVIEPQRVLTAHMSALIKSNAESFFGFDEAKQILKKIEASAPALVEEYNKKVGGTESLVKVMKLLLQDNIPLIDVKAIVGSVVEFYSPTVDPIFLAQHVRNNLGRSIINSIFKNNPIELIIFDSALQASLVNNVVQNGHHVAAIEPNLANTFVELLERAVVLRKSEGLPCVLAVDENIRYQISQTLGSRVSGLDVIASQEIPDGADFVVIDVLKA